MAVRRLSQEGNGFETHLRYTVRPCLRKRSGVLYHRVVLNKSCHNLQITGRSGLAASLAGFFLPFSSCWCQQEPWTLFQSEWYNLGREVWSESRICSCSLLSLVSSTVNFPPIGGNLSERARESMRAVEREEVLGQDFLLKDCFLFAALLSPQHTMFSWQNRP